MTPKELAEKGREEMAKVDTPGLVDHTVTVEFEGFLYTFSITQHGQPDSQPTAIPWEIHERNGPNEFVKMDEFPNIDYQTIPVEVRGRVAESVGEYDRDAITLFED